MTCDGDRLATALRRIVGEHDVLVDPDVRAPYERDWTGRFHGTARLVVRPRDTAQVAEVLRACGAAAAPVVPQGGNTGLVGGGVPRNGEVVLSLSHLRDVEPIDLATRRVDVGAGVTLQTLQAHAAASDLDAGLDLAARDAATIGGLVACEAGGLRALRYGTARARVAGVEAVLADGTVIGLRPPLVKDNAGYALNALLVGSEGTLGVVTRVRWQLVPRPRNLVTALVPLPGIGAAVDVLETVSPRLAELEAAEFLLDDGLQLVLDHLDLPAPVPSRAPVYLLLECAGQEDPTESLIEALQQAGVDDAVIATDSSERARLWRFREEHAEAISRVGTPQKFDVGIPLRHLAAFIERLPGMLQDVAPGAQVYLFGHLGDGNVHVNVIAGDDRHEALSAVILPLAAECGGTISAEHGIGSEKGRWLHLLFRPAELAAMRAVKRALDPEGLLNPGVVLPA